MRCGQDSSLRYVYSNGCLSGLFVVVNQQLQSMLKSVNGQPLHVVAMLRLCTLAMDNVHRMCPEEQRLIGFQSVKLAEVFLAQIKQTGTSFLFDPATLLSSGVTHSCVSEHTYTVERLLVAVANRFIKYRSAVCSAMKEFFTG